MFHFILNIVFMKDLISKGYSEKCQLKTWDVVMVKYGIYPIMVFITPGKESSVLSLIAELNSKGRL